MLPPNFNIQQYRAMLVRHQGVFMDFCLTAILLTVGGVLGLVLQPTRLPTDLSESLRLIYWATLLVGAWMSVHARYRAGRIQRQLDLLHVNLVEFWL